MGVGDNLDPEDVGETGTAVIAEGAKDEVFAFLIEDQDTREHFGGRLRWLVGNGKGSGHFGDVVRGSIDDCPDAGGDRAICMQAKYKAT